MSLPSLMWREYSDGALPGVPEHALHQVRVECQVTPRHLTIVGRGPPWRPDFEPEWTSLPVARLRYTTADKSWTLYWRDVISGSFSMTCCLPRQAWMTF